jgi:rhamnulokinase
VPQNVGEMARCVFESLSFMYRAVLEELEQLTRRDLHIVRIVGGGSLNQFFCQMIADATGRTVVAGPSEATALGSVMAQAVAKGHLPNMAAAREALRNSVECKAYEPRPNGQWHEAYLRFHALMNAKRAVQQFGS